MTWTKPVIEELSLSMEVTAYANSEDELPSPAGGDLHRPIGKALNDEQPE